MKSERIVRHTLDSLPAGRIDRDRVRDMTDAEIEAIARADADNPVSTDEELAAGQLVLPSDRTTKVPVYIRLDADVVEFFKASGPGYQTRINQALREAIQRSKRQRARRDAKRTRDDLRGS